jgi:hypothetical protein
MAGRVTPSREQAEFARRIGSSVAFQHGGDIQVRQPTNVLNSSFADPARRRDYLAASETCSRGVTV